MSDKPDIPPPDPNATRSGQWPPASNLPRMCLGCGAVVGPGINRCTVCGSESFSPIGINPGAMPHVFNRDLAPKSEITGRHATIWSGVGLGNLVGSILMAISYAAIRLLHPSENSESIFVLTETVLVPLIIGFISGLVWRRALLSIPEVWGYSALSSIFGTLLAALFLREGTICLIMAFPMVVVLEAVGGFLGRACKVENNRVFSTALPLIAIFLLHDIYSPHDYNSSVTDVVVIHAAPSEVWPHLASFSSIPNKPTFWMFEHGLPMPMQSISSAPVTGASRACIFSGRAVFQERIIDATVNHRLAFNILHQPNDPEIFNHATIQEGEFDLQSGKDGKSTILTGITKYDLHAFPAIYFDQWAQLIGHNVHTRVMDHIKFECEHEHH